MDAEALLSCNGLAKDENSVSAHQDADFIKHLENQIENLDDDEFQLPPVSELPTLESILNDDNDDPASASDNESNFLSVSPSLLKTGYSKESENASILSKGSSDSRSRWSAEQKTNTRRENRHHGSVLKHIVLKGITMQLLSANERVGAGLPTTMSVGQLICIGTSHGLVLVFEPSQVLKWCFGSCQEREQFGSVSALAINQESTKLLAGFAKGHLCLFDLTSGKLLQNIPDAHTPFSAVLHIKWTDCPGLAILSDSGGSVFELSLKKTIGVNSNESRCIFSGSRGEVCAIEPLIMGYFLASPPGANTVIVAMATISKMIVVSLRPRLKVLFSHPLRGVSSTLPLLAWQFVIIQMSDGSKVIDPVIAFARENTIFFYQLTHGLQEELTFLPLQKMNTCYMLEALSWLNSGTIALIDTQECLHVINLKTQEEIGMVDLARLGLVYASSHFKALATGGNVSKALMVAGERACYHSMISFGSQVLLLGTKSFQVVTMRNWVERIDHMVRHNRIGDALLWLLDILKGKAVAVIGLTHKKSKRSQMIRQKIKDLLNLYVEKSLASAPDRSDMASLTSFYEMMIGRCVRVSVEADFKDLLFGKIWETFSEDPLSKGIFLEHLEPYILDDQITEMSPSISQCFLTHYEEKGQFEAVEACVVHLLITSLDLHQTMTLCWSHCLYDAIVYIYNRGMGDYITPLEELLIILQNALDSSPSLTDVQISLGHKTLVYISCCFAGRAYPRGEIEPKCLRQVKYDVFKCITSLHSKNAKDSELAYPFLRTLLRFDTRDFLNVLALAFQEEEFTSELGMIQRQRVVDLLLQVMVVDGGGFQESQLASLFTFIARQISRRQGGVALNRELLEQTLNHLATGKTDSYHEERQTALMELIQTGTLKEYEVSDILVKAKDAHFYRVCEFLYEKTGDHEKILECYTKDKMRRHQVFVYIRNTLTATEVGDIRRQKVLDQVVCSAKSLMQVDTIELARHLLTVDAMSSLIAPIAEQLINEAELLFDYLQALFATRSSHMTPIEAGRDGEGVAPLDIEQRCDHILFPEMQEKYIDLMCELQPTQVLSYLNGCKGYRISETLEICTLHNLKEAMAHLLEKNGKLKEAFDVHIVVLKEKIHKLTASLEEGCKSLLLLLNDVQSQVITVIGMCQKVGLTVDDDGKQKMWFFLLDLILALQSPLAIHTELTTELRAIIGRIVSSMMAHIGLPLILERIMQDPGYSDCRFDQIKHLLKDMVERYSYEDTLYSTVVKILHSDELRCLSQQKLQAGLPIAINCIMCTLCHGGYHPSCKAKAFSCGHSYHVDCGAGFETCAVCKPTGVSIDPEREQNVPTEGNHSQVQMDEKQLEGLERIATLDNNSPWLRLIDRTKCLSVEPNEENASKEFGLDLAPPSLSYQFNDY